MGRNIENNFRYYWSSGLEFFSVFNSIENSILTIFGIQYYWNFGIEHFQYSIVLNGIRDIFGIPEIPKIPKCTTSVIRKSNKNCCVLSNCRYIRGEKSRQIACLSWPLDLICSERNLKTGKIRMCTGGAVIGEIFLLFLVDEFCQLLLCCCNTSQQKRKRERSLLHYIAHWQILSEIVRKLKNHFAACVSKKRTFGNHLAVP